MGWVPKEAASEAAWRHACALLMHTLHDLAVLPSSLLGSSLSGVLWLLLQSLSCVMCHGLDPVGFLAPQVFSGAREPHWPSLFVLLC